MATDAQKKNLRDALEEMRGGEIVRESLNKQAEKDPNMLRRMALRDKGKRVFRQTLGRLKARNQRREP